MRPTLSHLALCSLGSLALPVLAATAVSSTAPARPLFLTQAQAKAIQQLLRSRAETTDTRGTALLAKLATGQALTGRAQDDDCPDGDDEDETCPSRTNDKRPDRDPGDSPRDNGYDPDDIPDPDGETPPSDDNDAACENLRAAGPMAAVTTGTLAHASAASSGFVRSRGTLAYYRLFMGGHDQQTPIEIAIDMDKEKAGVRNWQVLPELQKRFIKRGALWVHQEFGQEHHFDASGSYVLSATRQISQVLSTTNQYRQQGLLLFGAGAQRVEHYDQDGRLDAVYRMNRRGDVLGKTGISYDSAGQIATVDLGDGDTLHFRRTPAGLSVQTKEDSWDIEVNGADLAVSHNKQLELDVQFAPGKVPLVRWIATAPRLLHGAGSLAFNVRRPGESLGACTNDCVQYIDPFSQRHLGSDALTAFTLAGGTIAKSWVGLPNAGNATPATTIISFITHLIQGTDKSALGTIARKQVGRWCSPLWLDYGYFMAVGSLTCTYFCMD